MKTSKINRYLMVAILTLSVLPLTASYLLLQEVLDSAVDLAIKPQTEQLLNAYRDDLKRLRQLDSANEAVYKNRFLAATDELSVYQQPQLLRQVLKDTYLTYYLSLFILVLLLSLTVAVWLSRQVARWYRELTVKDIEKAKKLEALSHFDQWQLIAGKLAHEINNPLTPIEMMVSNLPRVYQHAQPSDFQQSLQDTQTVVSEEVQKLKVMVSHFSRFSKLPEPQLKLQDMVAHLQGFIRQQQSSWPQVHLQFECDLPQLEVRFDHLLFNQCLVNLINNAVQANPQLESINIVIALGLQGAQDLEIRVINEGKSIKPEQQQALFNLYYSTNNSSENMGLGLSIVRKIMLDHGGDVDCLPLTHGAGFSLSFPHSTVEESKPDE